MANHYGMAVIPARAGKPKDKPRVERAVNLVYQRVFAPLRNKIFGSLHELNLAIAQEIEKFKASSNVRKGVIIIEDAAMISELKEFLKKNSAKLEEKNNEVTNQTELKGRGEILVQKIPLRHQ